jgi:putative Holliday junction resolvase
VRTLALDLGDRRIGVAVSDETGTLASPVATLQRVGPKKDLETVAGLVYSHEAREVVVGLPLNMDGSEGKQAAKVRAFVSGLERRLGPGVPVVARDERLTSVAADEMLRERGLERRKRKGVIDQVAAVLILQEHLDERRRVARAEEH